MLKKLYLVAIIILSQLLNLGFKNINTDTRQKDILINDINSVHYKTGIKSSLNFLEDNNYIIHNQQKTIHFDLFVQEDLVYSYTIVEIKSEKIVILNNNFYFNKDDTGSKSFSFISNNLGEEIIEFSVLIYKDNNLINDTKHYLYVASYSSYDCFSSISFDYARSVYYNIFNGEEKDEESLEEIRKRQKFIYGISSRINQSGKYDFIKNQEVYIRVRGSNWSNTGRYSLIISKINGDQSIKVSDYNYEEQYFFEEKVKKIAISSGFEFDTNRLRCGFIDGKYLTLSANRKGAGTAFLEYSFPVTIKKLDIGISLWSATENITDQSADILLQYKNTEGAWVAKHNFSLSQMSKSKDLPDNFNFDFEGIETSSIRVIVTTTNSGGDNNKGRVVISDLKIFY